MNDIQHANPAEETRKQLIDLFLQRTFNELEQMRRRVPVLIGNEDAAWRELRYFALRTQGTAHSLELGVLSDCAKELAGLAEERFARVNLDAHFLLAVTSAIEMVAIELNALFSAAAHEAKRGG